MLGTASGGDPAVFSLLSPLAVPLLLEPRDWRILFRVAAVDGVDTLIAEDQVFDLIEYFHAHVSQGIEDHERSHLHTWEGCGWHYGAFDSASAQGLFRQRMNRTLTKYRGGFRINQNGQIEHTADEGLDQLIDAVLPTNDPDIAQRVAGAIALYRNRGRTEEDLRLAVRELFDVLEKLRPEVKDEMLTGDERDLFNMEAYLELEAEAQSVVITAPLADQRPVCVIEEEESLQLRALRRPGEPAVRGNLIIAEELHRHRT